MPSSEHFSNLLNIAQGILKANPDAVSTSLTEIPDIIEDLKLHQIELELQNEELKRSRIELEAIHKEFADLYEFAPCGYLSLNAKGIITRANLAATKLLGAGRDSLLHSSLTLFIKDGYDGSYLTTRRKATETKEKQSVTLPLKASDGKAPKWILADIDADSDAEENLLGWRITLVDITERKEAEEKLEKLTQNLQEKVEAELALRLKAEREKQNQEALLVQRSKMADMGEMLGAILHQWKQPLHAISFLTGAAEDMIDEDGKIDKSAFSKYQNHIHKQITNMTKTAQLFRDFLSPSKEKLLFMACESVGETIEIFNPLIIMEKIVIDVKEHEHFYIHGQKNEFMQVVMNILANAKDAIKEKNISNGKIEVSFENDGKTGIIRIRDNGGGIPEELLPDKIFEPYITTKGDKGTGIGLQIAKSIIEGHLEGKLWARNVEDGAEFVIELPLAENSNKEYK